MHVVELNDAGLRIASPDGTILRESPGYALLDHDRLLIGEPALREARLSPRLINHQFWDRLSLDPLPRPTPRARTQADLAYAHLADLWQAAQQDDVEVTLAVPGRFDRDQLALVLGIARELPLRAVGLVDLGVAALAAAELPAAPAIFVDAQLHRTTITQATVGAEIERQHVEDLTATSVMGLRDAWIGLIADAFVRETRLDPFHEARTEQQMYDRLDGWLDSLDQRGEAFLELEYQQNTFRVRVEQRQLIDRAQSRYLQLVERLKPMRANGATIVLSARMAALPGLQEVLEGALGVRCTVLDADAAVRGTLTHQALIRRDEDRLAFVTRLPNAHFDRAHDRSNDRPFAPPPAPARQPDAPAPASQQEPASRRDDAAAPTHVLVGTRAWPLRGGELRLGGADVEGQVHHDGLPANAACRIRCVDGRWLLEATGDSRPLELGGGVRAGGIELMTGTSVLLYDRVRIELIQVAR